MFTWLNHWAKLGGILSVVMLVTLGISESLWSEPHVLFQIHFIALLLHQFEEYVLPGGFKSFFNANIYGKSFLMTSPLTNGAIFIVNVLMGWSAYGISAYTGIDNLWLAIGLSLITITNGLLHTLMAIIQRKYNPGAITGSIIFIPFGFYFLYKLKPIMTSSDILSGIIVFFIGTCFIPTGISISSKIFPDAD